MPANFSTGYKKENNEKSAVKTNNEMYPKSSIKDFAEYK